MALNNPSYREVIEQFRRLYVRMRDDYSELKMHHEKVLAELRSYKETLASLSVPANPPEAASVIEPTLASVPTAEPKIEDDDAPKITVSAEEEDDDDEDDVNENDCSGVWMKDVDDALRGWVN